MTTGTGHHSLYVTAPLSRPDQLVTDAWSVEEVTKTQQYVVHPVGYTLTCRPANGHDIKGNQYLQNVNKQECWTTSDKHD
jgi:hypothetical protein